MNFRTSRDKRDRGAAIIEMAFVLPLLLLVFIGILELGGAFKDYLTASHAVRDGVRLLSAKGDDPDADCAALLATVDTLTLTGRFANIDRIEIYEADSNGDPKTGRINTYTFTAGDATDCDDWDGYPGTAYLPSSRNVLAGGADPLDIIGMRVVYDHPWFTGFPPFTGTMVINQTTISRVEPEGFSP